MIILALITSLRNYLMVILLKNIVIEFILSGGSFINLRSSSTLNVKLDVLQINILHLQFFRIIHLFDHAI